MKIVDGSKQVIFNFMKSGQKNIDKVDHYVCRPIIQKNTKIGPIYHWVK